LTGSSARKLKVGGANLLAGRAFVKNLHALTSVELGPRFDLEQLVVKKQNLLIRGSSRPFLMLFSGRPSLGNS
jgi:hypothetical protein